jgi:hypothetical protein
MQRHDFSSSIAFIPWNWRRSASPVVQLFLAHPQRLSLSVHGCDHTRGEFGTGNRDRLVQMSTQALDRMNRHRQRTQIPHDPVMVFPQGVFCSAAMSVLRRCGYAAVVNTEVMSSDPDAPAIKVSDLWSSAVMTYSSFPIFTRRYPSQGIENFAFDLVLGKPCIVVSHHDFLRDHCRHVVEFIAALRALNTSLSWGSLREVVHAAYMQRERSPGVMEVRMYATEMRLRNDSAHQRLYHVKRRETDPSTIRAVHAGSQPLEWSCTDGFTHFATGLAPGESTLVRMEFSPLASTSSHRQPFCRSLRTLVRRRLCEFRDNHV